MTRRKKFLLTGAAIPVALMVWFFAGAKYGDDHYGVHYVRRPPVASIEWGPRWRFIVQDGWNWVADPGRGVGAPGNVVEFPISRHTRVSVRLMSMHWIQDEFRGWESNHPRIRDWIDPCPCPREAKRQSP